MSEAYAPHPQLMGLPAISQFEAPRQDSMPLPSLPSLASGVNKRRRSPSTGHENKPNKVVKKSPEAKSSSDDSGAPDSDKKRNKLGYHRTSVACGHCRRRKIRCMMPDDDPSGRCSNCIRLKKECIFCPVESSNAGKGPNTSRAVSAPKASMRSVSPTSMHTYPYDTFHSMPYNAGHSSWSVPPPDTGLNIYGASTAAFNEPTAAYAYDTPTTTWDSSYPSTLPPISAPYESPLSISPVNQPYTRSPSVRPSPYPDSTYGSAATTNGKHPNEIGWAQPSVQPQRSMSLTVDSTGYRQTSPYRQSHSPQPPSYDQDRRSASIAQPPSLVMSGDNSSTPSLSEPAPLGSMSAPVGSTYLGNPWTPIPGGPNDFDGKPLGAVEPFGEHTFFPDPINGY